MPADDLPVGSASGTTSPRRLRLQSESGHQNRRQSLGSRPAASPTATPVPSFNVAESHDSVTIFFSDLCGFSTWAHELPPERVMRTLDDLYTR